MQTPTLPTPTTWLAWLLQTAVTLGGTGIFVRLLLWPAVKNLMRQELEPELASLRRHHDQIAAVEQKTLANAEALAVLAEVPVMLARIEANVNTLMERRRAVRE